MTATATGTVSARVKTVICVDLDGTLVAGDLFWESLVRLLAERPVLLFVLPFWAFRGRACLKREVALRVALKADQLPYRPDLLEYLKSAHNEGHELVLATASDELYARRVCEHLGIFSSVVASNGVVNLKGQVKAIRLQQEYGQRGFHYVGNDWADLAVWEVASAAIVVAAPARLIGRVRENQHPTAIIGAAPSKARAIVRAMRLHQWAKNLLVFVPLVLAHRIFEPEVLVTGIVAFFSFGFCASSIYIVNDVLDLQPDRAHPRKRLRPIAAGELSIPLAAGLAAGLQLLGLGAAALGTSPAFVGVLLLYMLVTTAYSWKLKREPVLDVFVLAGLYVVRVIGGGLATGIPISNWLAGFALFLFLSLAFVKRYAEVIAQKGQVPGRGYNGADHPWLLSIGTSAGYMCVVILAIYVNSAEVAVLYTRPRVLWLAGPVLLYWVTRMWLRAGRQELRDDPVLEALKDPTSYICAAVAMGILLAAL